MVDERIIAEGHYLVENKTTIRGTAEEFNLSKSTVHKDLTEKLPYINGKLAKEVRKVLNINWDEKYLRGGLATKKMYEEKKKYKEAV